MPGLTCTAPGPGSAGSGTGSGSGSGSGSGPGSAGSNNHGSSSGYESLGSAPPSCSGRDSREGRDSGKEDAAGEYSVCRTACRRARLTSPLSLAALCCVGWTPSASGPTASPRSRGGHRGARKEHQESGQGAKAAVNGANGQHWTYERECFA